jgi:hypothetical protein
VCPQRGARDRPDGHIVRWGAPTRVFPMRRRDQHLILAGVVLLDASRAAMLSMMTARFGHLRCAPCLAERRETRSQRDYEGDRQDGGTNHKQLVPCFSKTWTKCGFLRRHEIFSGSHPAGSSIGAQGERFRARLGISPHQRQPSVLWARPYEIRQAQSGRRRRQSGTRPCGPWHPGIRTCTWTTCEYWVEPRFPRRSTLSVQRAAMPRPHLG